jgi:hypothetical protein
VLKKSQRRDAEAQRRRVSRRFFFASPRLCVKNVHFFSGLLGMTCEVVVLADVFYNGRDLVLNRGDTRR